MRINNRNKGWIPQQCPKGAHVVYRFTLSAPYGLDLGDYSERFDDL